MAFPIKDGAGTGNLAKVDSTNHLFTRSVVESNLHNQSHLGNGFTVTSGDTVANTLTVTATGGALLWMTNTSSVLDVVIDQIIVSASASTMVFKVVTGSTLGSVADNVAQTPVNLHTGKTTTAPVTAHGWDEANNGIGGLTLGSTVHTQLCSVGSAPVDFEGALVLAGGGSLELRFHTAGEAAVTVIFHTEAAS